MSTIERFDFEFEPAFRPLLALAGVTPATSRVTVSDEKLVARFGPWSCVTPTSNVREVCRTGPYQWFKAIGARLSFADQGLTFGTTTAGGVCLLFHEPVRGLMPVGPLRHPGLTVTLADAEGFVASVRRHARLT
jgi:hypothetical protein